MKTTMLVASSVAAICVGSASADVLFMAPGMSAQVVNQPDVTLEAVLKPSVSSDDLDVNFTEYKITAIHCVLKVNNPLEVMDVHNNGNFNDGEVTNTISISIDGTNFAKNAVLNATNEKDVYEVNLLEGLDPVDIAIESLDSGVKFMVTQSYDGAGAVNFNDDSYVVVEATYSLDHGGNTASVGQKGDEIAKHDSTCAMTWSLGTISEGGPNNGFGNNEDQIDPTNQNYIEMIGKWYPASEVTMSDGFIIVDDDEM